MTFEPLLVAIQVKDGVFHRRKSCIPQDMSTAMPYEANPSEAGVLVWGRDSERN